MPNAEGICIHTLLSQTMVVKCKKHLPVSYSSFQNQQDEK